MDALSRHVARRPLPAAVVAGGGGASRTAALRSLARVGAPVVAVGYDAAHRLRSRSAFPVLAPCPNAAPEEFVDLLLELAGVIGRPSPVFPLEGDALDVIAAARERLGERYRYPFPPWDDVSASRARRRQLEAARALGIPTPRSAEAPTDELGFPVLVTPSDAAGFRRRFRAPSFRCATRAALDEAFTRARDFDPIVEEVVPTRSLSSVGSYLADDGEALAVFCVRGFARPGRVVGRRHLEVTASEELVERALALLRDLALSGLAQVNFVRDERDGSEKLSTVELRLSRWHAVAAAAGIDLLRVSYWDLLGARLSAAPARRARRSSPIAFLRSSRAVLGARPPSRRRERERTPSAPAAGRLVSGRRR